MPTQNDDVKENAFRNQHLNIYRTLSIYIRLLYNIIFRMASTSQITFCKFFFCMNEIGDYKNYKLLPLIIVNAFPVNLQQTKKLFIRNKSKINKSL